MKLEDYFDFLSPDDIRIKGTRIGIETVLYEYIYRERSPEDIARQYPGLMLDQVYATILYYLRNKSEVDTYLAEWLAFGKKMRAMQDKNPPPVVIKLRRLKKEQQKSLSSS
jgi:uncharacterized protein (DUF433 family)